jgi:uncharacterized protein YvpB
MSQTSSAIPFRLYHYADVTTRQDYELVSEAGRLGATLLNFEASCTEYPVHVSYLADRLCDHARRAEGVDLWVRIVGQGFEAADRAGAPVWILRGQGALVTQAASIADGIRLFVPEYALSLYLQILNTKAALNMALLRINYLIFSLKVTPWLDLIRLPGALWEKYRPLVAGGLIASSLHLGHAYSGQIIINLPDFLKNFGFSLQEVRSWAGLSSHLTHIKYTSLPKHIFWFSLAMSVPSLISKWQADIGNYATGGNTGTQLASALTADTVLTLAPVATSYVGAIAGMKVGALIGTAIAPGPGTVIGGAVGAIVVGVITAFATDEVIERTDAREKSIAWLDENVFGPLARGIATAGNVVERWVDEAALRLRQRFQGVQFQANKQASSSTLPRASASEQPKQSEPMQAHPLTVPFVSQWNGKNGGNNCGPASLAMVIDYYEQDGSPMTAEQVASRIRNDPSGYTDFKARNEGVRSLLEEKQLTQDDVTDVDDLKRHLDLGHPVITLLENRHIKELPYPDTTGYVGSESNPVHHIVVVTGYVSDANGAPKEIIVNDPLAVKTVSDSKGKTTVIADPNQGQGFRIPWAEFKAAVDKAGNGSDWYASATYRKQSQSI